MSVTVRLWTEEELQRVTQDKFLATLLLNKKTLSKEELRASRTLRAETYIVSWRNGERVWVKAIDEESLGWFLEQEYTLNDLKKLEWIVKDRENYGMPRSIELSLRSLSQSK